MHRHRVKGRLHTGMLLGFGGAVALWSAPGLAAEAASPWLPKVDFSADVVRSDSARPERASTGKMYVSSHGIRTEGVLQGQPLVMIFQPARREAWMLLPEQKRFVRHQGVEMRRPPLPDEAESPCRTRKEYACRNQGPVVVAGRETHLWEVVVRAGDKEASRAKLWVDPKLQIAIREEYSDGLKVELRAIREEGQPPGLFGVPTDYQELKPQEASPPAGGMPPQPPAPSTPTP